MLNADAIQEIVTLAQSEVVDVDGHKYHKTATDLRKVVYPTEDKVIAYSLTQFVSYLKETASPDRRVLVNINGHNSVEAILAKKDKNQNSVVICKTSFEEKIEVFREGDLLTQEQMIIKLQSKFAKTSEVEALLRIVSHVTASKTSTSDDNGYAQTATFKSGVHVVSDEQVAIKTHWRLPPFRSFPEIEPVEIPFVFRLHQRESEMPKFALYEADGGGWKVDTTIAIRSFLQGEFAGQEAIRVL